MIAELRDMKEKLALYTDITEIERRVKKLNTYICTVPYYSNNSGKIVGVDLYFEKTARKMLSRVVNHYQLPLF